MSKMKKVLAGLVLSTVVATSVYANCNMSKDSKMSNKHSYHKMKMPIVHKFKQLDLSKAQKQSMKKLMKEFRTKKQNLNKVFKNSTFNKNEYIKIMSEKRDNMIKSKADFIEKAYAILDNKQKAKLQTLFNKN